MSQNIFLNKWVSSISLASWCLIKKWVSCVAGCCVMLVLGLVLLGLVLLGLVYFFPVYVNGML